MSRIKRSGTLPENKFKSMVKGFVYQPKGFYGNPDFINRREKVIIFVDGCFWHKCPKHYKEPKSNKEYWIPKIERNVQRDKEIRRKYRKDGWKVIRVWEHAVKK